MGHSQVEKAKTHDRIVAIAARRFREAGLDGLSIGDLMKEAGLTHGGFYKHFASREDLVVQAVTAALVSGSEIGKDGRAKAPPSYLDLIAYYLSERHRQDTGGG
ncbi:MAG: TetR/AcrR family transcriptional regulator, partial [Caulobacteraceae bacterium]